MLSPCARRWRHYDSNRPASAAAVLQRKRASSNHLRLALFALNRESVSFLYSATAAASKPRQLPLLESTTAEIVNLRQRRKMMLARATLKRELPPEPLPQPDQPQHAPQYWILDKQGEPLQVFDVLVWADWLLEQRHDRLIAQDHDWDGHWMVRTEFRAVVIENGRRQLWQSTVQGGPLDGTVDVYETREDAYYGHKRLVAMIRARMKRGG